jgi:hypothetical protein
MQVKGMRELAVTTVLVAIAAWIFVGLPQIG